MMLRISTAIFVITAGASGLSGCGTTDIAGLRGAGSMRIEVEVYKGPLSKTTRVQHEELLAKVKNGDRLLKTLKSDVQLSMCRLGCLPMRQPESEVTRREPNSDKASVLAPAERSGEQLPPACNKAAYKDKLFAKRLHVFGTKEGGRTLGFGATRYEVCKSYDDLSQDINWAISEFDKFSTDVVYDESLYKNDNEYGKFARLGADLRNRADSWALDHAAVEQRDRRIRTDLANYMHTLADFGNQLSARADALLVQSKLEKERYNTEKRGRLPVAQRLSTGTHLRDSSSTAFLNLYDWNHATNVRSYPGKKIIGTGLSSQDAVRLVEQLMQDSYWSKINTVHASGQGDVSMAFIKDDIGNWNLKSFSNDPTKLLKSYNDLARGAIKEALSLVSNSTGPGQAAAAAKNLMDVAQKAIGGNQTTAPTLGAEHISDLHDRTKRRLEEARDGFQKLDDAEAKKQTELEEALKVLRTERIAAENGQPAPADPNAEPNTPAEHRSLAQIDEDIQNEEQELTGVKAVRTALGKKAAEDIRTILNDHSAVIAALEEAHISQSGAADEQAASTTK